MRDSFLTLLLAIILMTLGQYSFSQTSHSHKHSHDHIEVSSYSEQPAVALEVTRDSAGGWNLQIRTMNFRFAPENVNGPPKPGEGHAHLYVDGKKIARLYGAWFHLQDLSSGQHEITVTLNANNHATLVLDGEPIAATVEIMQ